MNRASFLLVANYNSGVGYAWWLIEGFWCEVAKRYHADERVIIAYPAIDSVPAAIQEAKLDLIELDFTSTNLWSLWRQVRAIRKLCVRTLYLTDRSSASIIYAVYRVFGVRSIIVHDHTPGGRRKPVGLRRLVKRVAHALPLFRASAMIGATSFVTERHREVNMFPANRCFTAINGLPDAPPAVEIDVRGAFGIASQNLVVVSVGRLSPIKGIQTVLEAIAFLVHQEGCKRIHYIHFGDGPLMEALRQFTHKLGIEPWVTFAGRVADVRPFLRSCDIGLHASQGEVGYSLSILEFMQAGLPVVVSDDPSVCGATEDGITGFRFRPGDARAAADATKRLIVDAQLRKQLGERAERVQAEHFSLQATHRMLLHAVQRIRELDHNAINAMQV